MHLIYAGTLLSSQIRSYLLRSGSHFADPCQSLPALRARSLGEPVAEEGDGRCDCRPVRRRRSAGVSAPGRGRAISEAITGTVGEVRVDATSGEDAPD